jgi:hypothetical protein
MTSTQTMTSTMVECSFCGNETDRALRMRTQYVGTPAEKAESPMCLSCALGWPFSMVPRGN